MKVSDLSVWIVYEDDSLLVVDKPAGLVVNRSETTSVQTLQDHLADYFGLGTGLGVGGRAGIVHRLDAETSGLLIVAKNISAFENIQMQFKRRTISKEYVALVHGYFDNKQGSIDAPIKRIGNFGRFGIGFGGREAKTNYIVEGQYQLKAEMIEKLFEGLTKNQKRYLSVHGRLYSLVKILPKTGRTHQIRVHLKSINKPLVSDKIYDPARLLSFDLSWCPRLFLHAKSIGFTHPKTKKAVFFDSDLPVDLKQVFSILESSD